MGLCSYVGGLVRDHGSLQLGGGLGERPWVSEDRWGGWVRDHGSLRLSGELGERLWVSVARWGAG